jgi:hypothetical protein
LIGACDVSEQMPARAEVGVQLEGQMVRIKAVWPIKYKYPERVLPNQAVKLFRSRFFKVLGQIHTVSLSNALEGKERNQA